MKFPKLMREIIAGRRTNARFRADSVPQVKAADKSFEQMFKSFPRIQIPEPDILYGLSANTLPEDYCGKYISTHSGDIPGLLNPCIRLKW